LPLTPGPQTKQRTTNLTKRKQLPIQASLFKCAKDSLRYPHRALGQTRLDNKLVKNAIRPSAIGKKNWLFIGDPDAGQRSAILYSIVVSCQRHGKAPQADLSDVLARLLKMSNRDDLSALTPGNSQTEKNEAKAKNGE